MKNSIQLLANQQINFIHFVPIAIFIVMAWTGGLKAFQYEADGIVPFVINSPFMTFLYKHTGEMAMNDPQVAVPAYQLHKNAEGKTGDKAIEWHLYIFLRARNGHCAHWYNCIARDLVPNGGIMGRLADGRYVYSHLVLFNYHTRGLCAQLRRRFSYSAIWVSLLVWRRALGAKRYYHDGGRIYYCSR